eukprot:TRINITY_DN897_c0_g1_i2.p1 TRINITY_DN897_c0_g1~~TRINITY_DN897_c0_g1_i2.p1  ORF type:complete len:184 (+),score=31.20 TRINITY_DN897_c0_g1_i2:113-664(+)
MSQKVVSYSSTADPEVIAALKEVGVRAVPHDDDKKDEYKNVDFIVRQNAIVYISEHDLLSSIEDLQPRLLSLRPRFPSSSSSVDKTSSSSSSSNSTSTSSMAKTPFHQSYVMIQTNSQGLSSDRYIDLQIFCTRLGLSVLSVLDAKQVARHISRMPVLSQIQEKKAVSYDDALIDTCASIPVS